MSSIPVVDIKASASTVWRDALGPGYAVGAAEGLAEGGRGRSRTPLSSPPLTRRRPASAGAKTPS